MDVESNTRHRDTFPVVFSSASVKFPKYLKIFRGTMAGQLLVAMVMTTGLIIGIGVIVARTRFGPIVSDMPDFSYDSEFNTSLREEIHQTSIQAAKANLLIPLATTFEIQRDSALHMDFIVSFADAPATISKAANTGGASPVDDPLASRDLEVSAYSNGGKHALLLNKFNSFADHILLVTEDFQDQSMPLTADDLTALLDLVRQVPAIGFFNSGEDAGASQRHRHMQAIPLDVFSKYYRPYVDSTRVNDNIPVDELIAPYIQSTPAEETALEEIAVLTIHEFSFAHALVALPKEVSPEWLQEAYSAMLTRMHLYPQPDGTLDAYNLVAASRWMLLVPRSKRLSSQGVDVNGMGFIGCLLVRGDPHGGSMLSADWSPLKVLQDVTVPWR